MMDTLQDGTPYENISDVPREMLEQWYESMVWALGMIVSEVHDGTVIIPRSAMLKVPKNIRITVELATGDLILRSREVKK